MLSNTERVGNVLKSLIILLMTLSAGVNSQETGEKPRSSSEIDPKELVRMQKTAKDAKSYVLRGCDSLVLIVYVNSYYKGKWDLDGDMTDQIRTEVERQLKISGIIQDEDYGHPSPLLRADVNITIQDQTLNNTKMFFYYARIQLFRDVMIPVGRSQSLDFLPSMCPVWDSEKPVRIATTENLEEKIREDVKGLTKEFIDDWLMANTKK